MGSWFLDRAMKKIRVLSTLGFFFPGSGFDTLLIRLSLYTDFSKCERKVPEM